MTLYTPYIVDDTLYLKYDHHYGFMWNYSHFDFSLITPNLKKVVVSVIGTCIPPCFPIHEQLFFEHVLSLSPHIKCRFKFQLWSCTTSTHYKKGSVVGRIKQERPSGKGWLYYDSQEGGGIIPNYMLYFLKDIYVESKKTHVPINMLKKCMTQTFNADVDITEFKEHDQYFLLEAIEVCEGLITCDEADFDDENIFNALMENTRIEILVVSSKTLDTLDGKLFTFVMNLPTNKPIHIIKERDDMYDEEKDAIHIGADEKIRYLRRDEYCRLRCLPWDVVNIIIEKSHIRNTSYCSCSNSVLCNRLHYEGDTDSECDIYDEEWNSEWDSDDD